MMNMELLKKLDNNFSASDLIEVLLDQFTDEELEKLLDVAKNWAIRFCENNSDKAEYIMVGIREALNELWKLEYELGSREFDLNFELKHTLSKLLHEVAKESIERETVCW